MQWHPSVLSKLALVPQRVLGSFTTADWGEVYEAGDFVVIFAGCESMPGRTCDAESARYLTKWRAAFGVS